MCSKPWWHLRLVNMLIYSETSFAFIQKCERMIKEIIENETDFQLRRTRFEYKSHLYPIHIVIFIGENKLGYFDPNTYQIGINQALIYHAKDKVLKDILRHEFAHYITYLFYGNVIAHGDEFKHVCNLFNFPSNVSSASVDINLANNFEGDLRSEKIINKVKNLLKLAQSSNQHEAQLATLKANQLLLKHNLEYFQTETSEQPLYVHKVMISKRKNAKMIAIYDILKHFMVRPILSYGKNQVALEVTGNKTNIELAQYIAGFLEEELDRLWIAYQKEYKLKGLRAKNSFFSGIAKGHNAKMQFTQKQYSKHEQNALIVLNNKLDQDVRKIYRRLSSTQSSSGICKDAYGLGHKAGKNLTINKGLKQSGATKLISY